MSEGKKLLEEVKATAKQNKKTEAAKYKPWYINLLIWLVDVLSVIAILAFAIIGVRSFIVTNINPEYALAIAVIVVAVLSFRTVERIYRNRQ